MTTGAAQPWHFKHGYTAQPDESERQFAAFCAYLSMGSGRSLQAISQQLGIHPVTTRRWSSRYCWKQRIQAFTRWAAQQANSEANALTEEAMESLLAVGQTDALGDMARAAEATLAQAQASHQEALQKAEAAALGSQLAREVEALTPTEEELDLEAYQLAQQDHLNRLISYQQRVEAVGKSQLVMSGQFVRLVNEILAEHQQKRIDPENAPIPYAELDVVRRLAATAAQLGAAGRDLEGSALGVGEMLQKLEVIRINDARLLELEPAQRAESSSQL